MIITVKVTDLIKTVQELVEDKVDYVELMIIERDVYDDGEVMPATLHFSSYDGYGGGTDHDPIEEYEVEDVFYKFKHQRVIEL